MFVFKYIIIWYVCRQKYHNHKHCFSTINWFICFHRYHIITLLHPAILMTAERSSDWFVCRRTRLLSIIPPPGHSSSVLTECVEFADIREGMDTNSDRELAELFRKVVERRMDLHNLNIYNWCIYDWKTNIWMGKPQTSISSTLTLAGLQTRSKLQRP